MSNDEIHAGVKYRLAEMAGHLDALRLVLCAVVSTHPDKPALQAALRRIHIGSERAIVSQSPERLDAFDAAMADLMGFAKADQPSDS